MKRSYTDAEKATAWVALQANGGNQKRTARELQMPLTTLREWIKVWNTEGVPQPVAEATPVAIEEFIANAERVRAKALHYLEVTLPEARPRDLATTVGILTDKINISKGLATSRQETVQKLELPKREDVKELFEAFVSEAIIKARDRNQDIIELDDADYQVIEEQALEITEHSET